MTTSNPTQQSAPTENSKGELVWKPSVGVVFEPAAKNAQSYGGIVGALQDSIAAAGNIPKSYPYNFAGIIAAIQDLESAGEQIPVHPGPIPPGTEIIGGDLIIHVKPKDGTLWFDTRQGRLFVALDEEWYQTNGADGIAFVRDADEDGPPPTDDVVPGQFWYDPRTLQLYIYNEGEWILASSGDEVIPETAITILSAVGPKQQIGEHVGSVLPEPDLPNLNVQADLNVYYFQCLLELEDAVSGNKPVYVNFEPPEGELIPGQLWFDTSSLEMSIWYEDDDTSQWVPITATYAYDEDLENIRTSIATERNLRERALEDVYEYIRNLDLESVEIDGFLDLEKDVEDLHTEVDHKADLTLLDLYTKSSTFEAVETELRTAINEVSAAIPNVDQHVTNSQLNIQREELESEISEKTTMNAVQSYVETTLYEKNFATRSYLDQSLADLSQNFLTHAGGTLSGNLKINKIVASEPALDFSDSPIASMPAFKFSTSNTVEPAYATFGTTNNQWEYAWKFDTEEDFCWVHGDSNKVFSITKDGPACSTLYLADFGPNNVTGRVLRNKIDVKERLDSYQTAFEKIRQRVFSATDFESLKSGILSAIAHV